MPAKDLVYKKILVVRPDRLGDVILSMPVIESLRAQYPKAEITMMVQTFVAPVVKGYRGLNEVLVYDPKGRHRGMSGTFLLAEEIRKRRFDLALVLQAGFQVAYSLFLADVPKRVGPLSKWYSWIFYHRGYRQHRSQVQMHEAEYNLDLALQTGVLGESRKKRFPSLFLDALDVQGAAYWLEDRGYNRNPPLVAVHPGMSGSALNWPEEHYARLVAQLLMRGISVLLTSGPDESALIQRVISKVKSHRGIIDPKAKLFDYSGSEVRDLRFLAALQVFCDVVVAPSTGPLHLATAIGARTVSFYPPIKVQSAKRWGPFLRHSDEATVLTPAVDCPETFKCAGEKCVFYPCMGSIAVEEALAAVLNQLEQAKASPAD